VKLLLDQNLSPRLLQELLALYTGSTHVRDIGLERAAILAFNEDHEAAFLALRPAFSETVKLN
jgi:predicted nuclease of predicted toxin-antitoxin system